MMSLPSLFSMQNHDRDQVSAAETDHAEQHSDHCRSDALH